MKTVSVSIAYTLTITGFFLGGDASIPTSKPKLRGRFGNPLDRRGNSTSIGMNTETLSSGSFTGNAPTMSGQPTTIVTSSDTSGSAASSSFTEDSTGNPTGITSSQSSSSQDDSTSGSGTTTSSSTGTTTPITSNSSQTTSLSSSGGLTSSTSSILTPTSTITTLPAAFSLETVSNQEWTTNTWITTTGDDSSSTVVPVLVGCPGCGGPGGGIVLWNLPPIPNVEFNFPSLPSLPKFQLPCIQLLGISVGSCPGPEPVPEDNDGSSGSNDSPSPTSDPPKTETSADQSSTTESSSSCTQTSTVSHCAVSCKPTTNAAATTTSITCFTTVCSQTTSGCSVTGTTTTTTSIPSCTPGSGGVGRRADGCPLSCPSYEVPYDPNDQVDEEHQLESDDDMLVERNLVARAANQVDKFANCVLATPVDKPLKIPSNPPGGNFWKQDKGGFKHAKPAESVASQAVPRWYSTTVDASACAPTVVKIDANAYTDGDGKSNQMQRATIDHSWEKGWLKEFFSSIIDDSAPQLDGPSSQGSGKMTCADFNKYVFDSGAQNLILDVFNGLPSKEPANLDFIGMTDTLNSKCKGAVSNPDFHLRNKIPAVISLGVSGVTVEEAIENMEQKFGQLERIRLGVYMTNLDESKRVADTTNNRLHSLIKQLDANLASKYPKIVSFEQDRWFFTRKFQSFMDGLVADSPGTIRDTVKDYANQLIGDISSKMATLDGQVSQGGSSPPQGWFNLQTKWKYYQGLGPDAWDISLSWSWGCGRKRDGTPGACQLPPPASSVSASSSSDASSSSSEQSTAESTTQSTTQDTSTIATSTVQSGSTSTSATTAASPTTSTGESSSWTITSFETSTRTRSCTYVEPTLIGTMEPYCIHYGGPRQEEKCGCTDGKSYTPYTGSDRCQPICPLTSPADGYSEMQQPPTTTFQSFTTTDIFGNVQVCTDTSKVAGVATVCLGPTIHTEQPAPTPTPEPKAACLVETDGILFPEWYNVMIVTSDWITDGGDRLKSEEKGCGALTGWTVLDVDIDRTDDGGWKAVHQYSFHLPLTIKAGCVERAIASAGGPSGLQCENR